MDLFHTVALQVSLDETKKYSSLFSYHIFFQFFSQNKYTIKEKYLFVKKTLENIFLTEAMKDEFLEVFQKIQQKFLTIQRFVYQINYKRAQIVVENDLSLNAISEKDKNVIVIYQNNNKYLFVIRDMIQLIEKYITHSHYFFSCPLTCKNPYNNVVFYKSTLYNIYFFMRFKTLFFSEILHQFFLCNFHLVEFQNKNTHLLRNYAIHDFIKNESLTSIGTYILEMIQDHNDDNSIKIDIHPEYPLKKLTEVMKPYLTLYLMYKYSFITLDKVMAKKSLDNKLIKFQLGNPKFGRKMIVFEYNGKGIRKKVIGKSHYFIDKHVSFYEDTKDDFLVSHSISKEE
jgi:hypothetical protein